MQVPADLPVEVTSFIDLLALFISRGGPTLEEEIKFREKSNPYFAFLSAPWNDPMNVYYRWRLYALLQEGERQFLRWSTEPYQLEQGAEAIVWIPPPVVQNGIEHLSYLCDAIVHSDDASGDLLAQIAQKQRPAAMWISRLTTADESFFVAMKHSQVEEWKALLDYNAQWESVCASEPLADRQSISDELWLKRLKSYHAVVLAKDFIGKRMCTVVESGDAGAHCISFVVDAVVRCCVEVVGICETSRWSNDQQSPYIVSRHLLTLLSYLFLLHDACRNGSASPLSDEEVATILDAEEVAAAKSTGCGNSGDSEGVLAALGAGKPSGHPGGRRYKKQKALVRAIEWSMPTIIESVVRVSVACAGADGHGQQRGLDVAIEAPESDGILDDHDPQPTVRLLLSVPLLQTQCLAAPPNSSVGEHSASEVQNLKIKASMRLLAFQVTSWTRTLVLEWGDAGLVGTRCWLKLQSAYNFFLCRPIEDVCS